MSCHDLIVPVARLRSSTRRGGAGTFALAPRPWAGAWASVPGAGVVGFVTGGVAGGVAGGVVVPPPGAPAPPPPARPPRPPRPPALGSTVYAIHLESAEKFPPLASVTSTCWFVSRLTRCSTGLDSAVTVLVSEIP